MEQTKSNTLHGTEYSEEDVFHFPLGIPGFENLHKFVLSEVPGQEPFKWLNSVEDTSIRFILINPLEFAPDYNPKFQKEQATELKLEKPEDMLLFVIVTLKATMKESTANLAGPLVLNVTKRLGKQIILDDNRYSVCDQFLKRGGQ